MLDIHRVRVVPRVREVAVQRAIITRLIDIAAREKSIARVARVAYVVLGFSEGQAERARTVVGGIIYSDNATNFFAKVEDPSAAVAFEDEARRDVCYRAITVQ